MKSCRRYIKSSKSPIIFQILLKGPDLVLDSTSIIWYVCWSWSSSSASGVSETFDIPTAGLKSVPSNHTLEWYWYAVNYPTYIIHKYVYIYTWNYTPFAVSEHPPLSFIKFITIDFINLYKAFLEQVVFMSRFFPVALYGKVSESHHLKNMLVKLDHFPTNRVEHKKHLRNHLGIIFPIKHG